MTAASDVAMLYNRPVVLGDQRINVTGSRLGAGIMDTVKGSWQGFVDTIRSAAKDAVPTGPGYLGLSAFFDPVLLSATPVSLVRYPVAFAIKSPIVASIVIALYLWSGDGAVAAIGDYSTILSNIDLSRNIDGGMAIANSAPPLQLGDIAETAATLVLTFLEIILLTRIFVKELLAERNEVLARNILMECKRYVQGKKKEVWWQSLALPVKDQETKTSYPPVVYVPESVAFPKDMKNKVVVAVLGMAHCNGVKKLLEEQKV
eukprot:CAMPEP_0116828510 /NCGR_PEP_ID=MMETSP0418-20121206/3691_1 /TAXON_ID=1158023 /ORGANISM="Astrosyne radiata, Strain 13vi08-1A" /LENGTH=260 /DNA_ID=CAMNT_0004457397 /DNA_START=375 /DNA_END=1157 /DNA_ORIENTATION=+